MLFTNLEGHIGHALIVNEDKDVAGGKLLYLECETCNETIEILEEETDEDD